MPSRRRIIIGLLVGVPWALFLLWTSSAEEYVQGNMWARLGVYGKVVHPNDNNIDHDHRYDAKTVARVNQEIRRWGNFVFLMPFGVIAAMFWERVRWWHALLAASIIAFLVQARDPIFRHTGTVTWNEILPNIAGAMVGFGAMAVVGLLWRRHKARTAGDADQMRLVSR